MNFVEHGRAMLFQHGLGGDAAQIAEHLPPLPFWRFATLECRAQGASPPGDARPFSIASFADDVLAAADRHGFGRFVMGGLSMGAAIALRLAVRHPGRVSALVLLRPAWLFDPAPPTMRPFVEAAALLRAHPPEVAQARFAASATGRVLAAEAPDNLASLLGFFQRPDPAVTADLLHGIATDGPGVTAAQAAGLAVPTLVIGNEVDRVHPMAYAERLATAIPGARLVRVAAKAADRPRHLAECRAALQTFLESLP